MNLWYRWKLENKNNRDQLIKVNKIYTKVLYYTPQGAEMVSGMIYEPDEQRCDFVYKVERI